MWVETTTDGALSHFKDGEKSTVSLIQGVRSWVFISQPSKLRRTNHRSGLGSEGRVARRRGVVNHQESERFQYRRTQTWTDSRASWRFFGARSNPIRYSSSRHRRWLFLPVFLSPCTHTAVAENTRGNGADALPGCATDDLWEAETPLKGFPTPIRGLFSIFSSFSPVFCPSKRYCVSLPVGHISLRVWAFPARGSRC